MRKKLNVSVERRSAGQATQRASEVNKKDKERGIVRSSPSSVEVDRTDALELPGRNSSGSRGLFLAIPFFQKEPFITPPAKYNKKWMGSGRESWVITICPSVT